MPFQSPFPNLEIPKTNILSYLYPPHRPLSGAPLWIDSNEPNETVSATTLFDWVKRVGIGFDKLGIKEGEVVLVYSPNHVFLPVIYLAIIANGRIFTGANPAYTAGELVYQLKDTGARLLLSHPAFLSTACEAARRVQLPRDRIFLFSEKENAPIDGFPDWQTSLAGSLAEAEHYQWKHMTEETATQTVAAINYSSGTTGLPKGVCVSHYNLIANVAQTAYIKSADKTWTPGSERWIGFLPLYHAYGQLYTCLVAPKLGVPVVIMKKFNFEDMLRTIQTHRITRLQIAPPVMVLLGKRPETSQYDLSSLKDITCGAAPLSRELQLDVARKLDVHVKQGWGMTEVTCGGLNTVGDEGVTGSVGSLFPNMQGLLVDDDGQEVVDGQPGEFWVRGPNVSLGYWKNEQATRDMMTPDGWLKTGDIAVLQHGFLYMVDRKKELIKVKGYQVAPAELEAILLGNDDIADVATVGMHIYGEERPRAYIMLKPEAKGRVREPDIHAWIQSRVAPHKYLKGGIAFVDEVPKSASGKILRKVLREWAKRDASRLESAGKSKL